jgi:hypothetical protein
MFESNQFLGNRFLEIKGASKLAGLFSRSQQLDLHFLQKKTHNMLHPTKTSFI